MNKDITNNITILGSVGVLLFNHSQNDFEINIGDKICMLICQCISQPLLQVVEKIPSQHDHDGQRGASGFGSTGR